MTDPTVTDALSAIAGTPRLLLALDFDGTLSPHEDDPMAARMLPAARDAVTRLAELPDTIVALVSGRSMSDLRIIAEHGDDSPLYLEGSHGAESWIPGKGVQEPADDPEDVALRDRLRAQAEQIVSKFDGVWIEPKTFGFGVHTRTAGPEAAGESTALVDALVAEHAPNWRRRTGKNIVEYAFRQEGKDTAVRSLRKLTDATAVLFAGDDVTDEDALRSLDSGDLGVRVGAGETAATVTVPDIPAFAALLDELATRRTALLEAGSTAQPE